MSLLWLLLFCFTIARVSSSCCSLNEVLRNGKFDYVDLTFPIDNRTYYFKPEGKSTSEDERPIQPVVLTRGGTQFESPSGFDAEGAYIVDIPAELFIVQMIVIDVSSKVNDNPNFVLVLDDLLSSTDIETLQALRSAPSLLVLKFGWGKYYNQVEKYVGYNPNTETYAFPVVGTAVAEWLTNNETTRNVVGIAVDLPNIECTGSSGFPVHKRLAKAGIYIVENLNLIDKNLPPHSCTIGVMAVKKAGESRNTATLAGICQKNTCEEDNIKNIDKREDHKKEKHKCKKTMHHDSHGGDEHSSHESSNSNNASSGENNSQETSNTNNASGGENSSQSSGTTTNNSSYLGPSGSNNSTTGGNATSNNNNTSSGGSSNSGSYNKESKGPQKIIDSVFKFKEMFNKDKQQ